MPGCLRGKAWEKLMTSSSPFSQPRTWTKGMSTYSRFREAAAATQVSFASSWCPKSSLPRCEIRQRPGVHGRDRADAIRRLMATLDDAPLLGLKHNARFLRDLVDHPRFR